MLARSQEELEIFNQMDQEMYERENKEQRMKKIIEMRPGLKDYSRINYRLIQDWEVPEWVKVRPEIIVNEQDEILNLGKRQRKTLINMDNLSEQQWLKAVEEGEDLQEVMKRDNLKRQRRAAEGKSFNSESGDEGDDAQDDFESEPSGPNAKKKK